jgi:hypothetical protein
MLNEERLQRVPLSISHAILCADDSVFFFLIELLPVYFIGYAASSVQHLAFDLIFFLADE